MAVTTYMSIDKPTSEVTLGPLWSTMLNTAIDTLDSHRHIAGEGRQVPSAGIGIDADLEFNGYDATELRSTRYESQGAALATSADLGCLYSVGGNLYWNNASGTAIQLTSGGSINVGALTSNEYSRVAVTTNLTILAGDAGVFYEIDSSGGTRTITMPAANAVSAGRFYVFADIGGTAVSNAQTVQRPAAGAGSTDTMDGASSVVVGVNYGGFVLISDGTSKWKVLHFADPTKLRGASVPAGSGLTTGNVLQVSGAAALSYGAVNLAGGANYVTGVLPTANMAQAAAGSTGAIQLADDLGGSASSPDVVGITGTAGVAAIRMQTLQWIEGASAPFFGQTARTSSGNGVDLTIYAQDGHTNGGGGDLILCAGNKAGSGLLGRIELATGGFGGSKTIMAEVSNPVTNQTVLALCGNDAVSATDMPANTGDGVVWLGNAFTAPTASPANGVILYGNSGRLGVYPQAGGPFEFADVRTAAVGGAQTKKLTVYIGGVEYFLPLYTA